MRGGLVPANPVILAFTSLHKWGEIASYETAHDPIKMCCKVVVGENMEMAEMPSAHVQTLHPLHLTLSLGR